MSDLFSLPLLLAFIAFVTGLIAAKFAAYVSARATGLEAPEHERAIRALEANLRVVRKDAAEANEKLEESTQQLEILRETGREMEQTLQCREEELDSMREAVQSESKKVVELRRTLTERAEETIRAKRYARESETELNVLKAGATDIFDDTDHIEAEREELTNRLRAIEAKISGESDAGESEGEQIKMDDAGQSDETSVDQHMSDC